MTIAGLAALDEFTQRIDSAVNNLRAIREAKRKQAQEDELFNLNKQKAQIELKAAKASGELDEKSYGYQKAIIDQQLKDLETIGKAKKININHAEENENQKLQQIDRLGTSLIESDPDVRVALGLEQPKDYSFRAGGMEFKSRKPATANDILNRIELQNVLDQQQQPTQEAPQGYMLGPNKDKYGRPMYIEDPEYKQRKQLELERQRNEIDPSKQLSAIELENVRRSQQSSPVDAQPQEDASGVDKSGLPPKYIEMPDPQDRFGRPKLVENPDYKNYYDQQKFKREAVNDLRKEFNNDKIYKNFQIVKTSENAIQNAYKMATDKNVKTRIAADQALGVLFQKMLDPDSVVRESEFARTEAGQAFFNKITGITDQLVRGGLRLKDSDRKALLDSAKELLKSHKMLVNDLIDRYTDIGSGYGLDQEDMKKVFGNIEKFDVGSTMNTDVELNQKIQRAREAGYTDEEIEQYLNGAK